MSTLGKTERAPARTEVPNGPAISAYLAAGIGTFAMGLVVILNEVGLFTAPTLYGPAGGVSGRTTFATAIWLLSWGVLHARWKNRAVEPKRPYVVTLILIGVGLVLLLPPVWALFS
jgi:hypothetical protein